MPTEYDETRRLAAAEGLSAREAELRVIGVDHAALGARLAEKWRLSRPVIAAIAGHHDPDACEEVFRPLAATVSIADYVVTCAGLSARPGARPCPPDERVWREAELTGARLSGAVGRFLDALPQVDELMQLAG